MTRGELKRRLDDLTAVAGRPARRLERFSALAAPEASGAHGVSMQLTRLHPTHTRYPKPPPPATPGHHYRALLLATITARYTTQTAILSATGSRELL